VCATGKNRFVSQLEASGGTTLLQIEVSEVEARVDAWEVLRRLRDGNARIVFIATNPDVQRAIFHAVYESRDEMQMCTRRSHTACTHIIMPCTSPSVCALRSTQKMRP